MSNSPNIPEQDIYISEDTNDSVDQPQVSNVDFATEVKIDRLKLLIKVTMLISVFLLMIAIVRSASFDLSLRFWILMPSVFILSGFLTQQILNNEKLDLAAIVYSVGGMLGVAVALSDGTELITHTVPFIFILLTFITGLLVRPQLTLILASVAALITIAVPSFAANELVFSEYQASAIVLTFLSAILAAQVTGELYAVTEWALMNYERQRRTNVDLFENRLQLQRTLKRSEALSEQLAESNQELEQAHKAAEEAKHFRGQFLANMSHELRTPLNAIIGFSETMIKFPMMYDNEPLPEMYRNDLNQIHNSGRLLLHLINDILDLAKVDAGRLEIYMQEVHPKPVIEAVISTTHGLIGNKSIELLKDLPDPMPAVWADEGRMRQVLLNIYSNAAKFTEEGSISLIVKEVDDGLQFSIKDTGDGIASDNLDTIFEEFKQGKSGVGRDPRAGSGLGLTISRQLLNLMGGTIWVESELGKGSTFHFTLQLYSKRKVDTSEIEAAKLSRSQEEA